MRADSQEQRYLHPPRKRFPIVELVLALAVMAGMAALWFYWEEDAKPVEPGLPSAPAAAAGPVAAEPGLPPAPDIPRRNDPATAPPESTPVGASTPLPTPATPGIPELLTDEEGDDLVRQQLGLAGPGTGLETLAGNDHPLEATAALIDSLGQGLIPRKMVQGNPPPPGFLVEKRGDVIYMDPENYLRFDSFADRVSALDTARLVDTFHTLRPGYERAYEKLGLDPGDFDNAIIRTLDLVLATPEIGEPIALNAKSLLYVYADPTLESLPAVQKQLLRMGPDNIRRIKQQARALREELLAR